jgi:hypothetical protein
VLITQTNVYYYHKDFNYQNKAIFCITIFISGLSFLIAEAAWQFQIAWNLNHRRCSSTKTKGLSMTNHNSFVLGSAWSGTGFK